MRIPDRDPTGPTPPTGDKVELTQEQAQRIFEEIMEKVGKDLGFSIKDPLLLEYDVTGRLMVLLDKALQRITFFKVFSDIYSSEPTQIPEIVKSLKSNPEIGKRLLEPKSEIAFCVAFLCYACSHQEVGDDVKRELGERQELRDLKSVIQSIIRFFGGEGFDDTNVKSITIDDNSYKVVIQLWSNSEKKEYQLNW